MNVLIILGLMAGVPLLLSTLFRINPLFMFVSIVSGYLWVQLLGDTAELVMQSFLQVSHVDVVSRITLLVLPFVFTLLFLRKTLSTSALPFYFILLVMNSLLLAIIIVPLLTPGVKGAIYQTHIGDTLKRSHDVMIAGAIAVQLAVMYILRPRSHSRHHK